MNQLKVMSNNIEIENPDHDIKIGELNFEIEEKNKAIEFCYEKNAELKKQIRVKYVYLLL